jgi:hypothetical protein
MGYFYQQRSMQTIIEVEYKPTLQLKLLLQGHAAGNGYGKQTSNCQRVAKTKLGLLGQYDQKPHLLLYV